MKLNFCSIRKSLTTLLLLSLLINVGISAHAQKNKIKNKGGETHGPEIGGDSAAPGNTISYALNGFDHKLMECAVAQAKNIVSSIFRIDNLIISPYVDEGNRTIITYNELEYLSPYLGDNINFKVPTYGSYGWNIPLGFSGEGLDGKSSISISLSDHNNSGLNHLAHYFDELNKQRQYPKEFLALNWYSEIGKGTYFQLVLRISDSDLYFLQSKGTAIGENTIQLFASNIPNYLATLKYSKIKEDPDLRTKIFDGLQITSFVVVDSANKVDGKTPRPIYLGQSLIDDAIPEKKLSLKFNTEEYSTCLSSIKF
ncbi:MAG: hypothetical protein QE271_00405 [Bacteriovoracaceae bacterium]|nr:hypothetical protein [Bacteriovoracaceae bacterium]